MTSLSQRYLGHRPTKDRKLISYNHEVFFQKLEYDISKLIAPFKVNGNEILLNQTTENGHVTLTFVFYPSPNRCPSQKLNPCPDPNHNLTDAIKIKQFQPKGKP